VTSLERHAVLIPPARARIEALGLGRAVTIREADGSLGDADSAPWDGIIVTAAAPSVPQLLRTQLRDGGRLVIPVGSRDRQLLTIVTRHGDEWLDRTDGYCIFVPLIGSGGFEA
jgi:protein-L-isoaspartate(D-aspartate) O-methyltransferase